ncbi:MAG: TonB family protein [Dysgonamonadaceae bacterium]|jgi:TonB family protein|nr:TonB family protein [Dysgonamonadaceae bacterium]
MKYTKEKIYGYIGSAVFCLLILLLLYFTVLHTEAQTGEEGVLVNFGNVDLASGSFEPRYQGENREVLPQEETAPPVQQSHQPETAPPVITQNNEESVAIEASKKKEEERKQREIAEAEQRRIAEARKKAEDEQKRREAINSQVSGAFGTGTSNQSNQGTGSSGSGNQGSTQGNSDTGVYTGTGGYGEFALNGRSLGTGGLPRPSYSVQEEGKIVINITVDPKGNVILAEIGRGTNIDNDTMRRSALEAARKAKFNSISGSNNQSGTITYRYSLK